MTTNPITPSNDEIESAYRLIRQQQSWIVPTSNKIQSRIFPNATYSPWLSDLEFISIFSKIGENTLVDVYRCYELWTLARQLEHVEGNILEVGVWRGGTGALISAAVKAFGSKKVYLADTFKGVVKAGPN